MTDPTGHIPVLSLDMKQNACYDPEKCMVTCPCLCQAGKPCRATSARCPCKLL